MERHDGLASDVTGLGGEADTSTSVYRCPRGQPSVWELEAEYIENWQARREIDLPVGLMFAEGVEIRGLPEGVDRDAIRSMLDGEETAEPDGSITRDPGLLHHAHTLIHDADLAGGAVLMPIIDDDLDYEVSFSRHV